MRRGSPAAAPPSLLGSARAAGAAACPWRCQGRQGHQGRPGHRPTRTTADEPVQWGPCRLGASPGRNDALSPGRPVTPCRLGASPGRSDALPHGWAGTAGWPPANYCGQLARLPPELTAPMGALFSFQLHAVSVRQRKVENDAQNVHCEEIGNILENGKADAAPFGSFAHSALPKDGQDHDYRENQHDDQNRRNGGGPNRLAHVVALYLPPFIFVRHRPAAGRPAQLCAAPRSFAPPPPWRTTPPGGGRGDPGRPRATQGDAHTSCQLVHFF